MGEAVCSNPSRPGLGPGQFTPHPPTPFPEFQAHFKASQGHHFTSALTLPLPQHQPQHRHHIYRVAPAAFKGLVATS